MKTYLIAGVMLVLSASVACAQPGKGVGRVDSNGDGKVTLAEFKAARAGQLMRMDADKDGKLSKAEFQAGSAARADKAGKAPKGDGSRMFGMVDGNGDGFLDRGELGKMAERRFGRMDADGDGALTPAELQAGRQRGGMTGGGR
ncbi:MAG TPA: hypothetical protein VEA44_16995 [Caulobacter sp.]|nr:hypothetical protein [Caulobacter sp.]